MKKIILDRGKGKTTELIKLANNYNGYIVCMNRDEAFCVSKMAKERDFNINFPITFQELIDGNFHPQGVKKLWIDNVEELLYVLTRHRVKIGAITMDKEGLITARKPFVLTEPKENE